MAGVYFDPVFFIEKNKLVLDSVHGLTKARDGTVWAKTAPPFGRRPTPASNIFHPPPKQVIHSRSLSSVGATYKRFINARMVDRIVSCMDKEGERSVGEVGDKQTR